MEKIYIIGHTSPDLDTVASAIAYANLKNQLTKTENYLPVIAGEVNAETDFALKKFHFEKPSILESLAQKKVILVDHNENSQSLKGREKAEIIEVLDHHKVDFSYSKPIVFKVFPLGASATIIARCYEKNNLEISKEIAGLLLSAILVDTVITKSPTCTEEDIKYIEKLAKIAQIEDWRAYGLELFKIRSSVNTKTPEEIIKGDFKDFNFKQGKIGIGQVETVDLSDFDDLKENLLKKLKEIQEKENYHSVILFITDIMKEGSLFLVAGKDLSKIEDALGEKLKNNEVYIPGIISRKKQVAPKFMEIFDK